MPLTKANTNDPLGYDTYAQTLWARVLAALNKDTGDLPLGDDPLVIGLFGEWGAGKSYLLKRIQDKADAQLLVQQKTRSFNGETDKKTYFDLTIPVFFQPWKYEHEEHLHVPILMHILDAYIDAFKKAQIASESGDTEFKAFGGKATTVLGWMWRRILRPASEAFTGQFSVKMSLAAEIEELAHAQLAHTKLLIEKASDPSEKFKATQDGLFFYKWHETLKQLTRPTDYPELLVDGNKKLEVSGAIRINFVIFIDDLDRCLPEKAVQSLELIKTIFNVESFAFVLALDDEVIERGIGHRYQAYNFAGKKPEMPITGFEYLEKIVHLPFRLPAITLAQASALIRIKELDLQPAPAKASAADKVSEAGARLFFRFDAARAGELRVEQSLGLTERATEFTTILLATFDQYVPRKLIRAIELLHQVQNIALQRGKSLHASGGLDSRLLFGLLLLQLFQPELFRVLKRRKSALRSLLAAFLDATQPLGEASDVAQVSIWQWACMYKTGATPAVMDHKSAIEYLALSGTPGDRYTCQQVRIPVAEALVAHLVVERHAFNPFKLLKLLSSYFDPTSVGAIDIDAYMAFLSEALPASASEQAPAQRAEVVALALSSGTIDAVFARLTGKDLGVQGEVLDVLSKELPAQQKMTAANSAALVEKLSAWLANAPLENPKTHLLSGVQHLAPFIHPDRAAALWALVQDAVTLPTEPNGLTQDPPLASLYCDVRSMLGQDTRFNASHFYLLKERYASNTALEEPIPGFVRMAGGRFNSGHEDQTDNAIKPRDAGAAFYIARSHVTVDQYAAFLADKPHEAGPVKNDEKGKPVGLWDAQGWAWITGELDKTIPKRKEKNWQDHLDRRQGAARHTPMDWATQQRVGSRAVHSITWFEARAYARWLNARLEGKLAKVSALSNYQVRLPTELQWEFAATGGLGSTATWPWGIEKESVAKRANIDKAKIAHASVAGCFAPNAQGLWDMAGNLWQWQDGLYRHIQTRSASQATDSAFKQLATNGKLTFGKSWDDSDTVSLRGGSWVNTADGAAAASRFRYLANDWFDNCGFRVVLSLAERES